MNMETSSKALTLADLAKTGASALALRVLNSVDSTSNEAKRMIAAGQSEPTLIAADSQTAGRGRMGRDFYSPSGSGIYFSVLYPTKEPLEGLVSITGAVSVAVMRAIRRLTGKQTAIKWVNDLYWNNKKVCGILCEAITGADKTNHLIIGIGLNLYHTDFPENLREKAGSIDADTVSREDMIGAITEELLRFLRDFSNREWLEDYRLHSYVLGKSITWMLNGTMHHGRAVAINDEGELEVVSTRGERVVLRTGEISILL